jgi:hypothetical protein
MILEMIKEDHSFLAVLGIGSKPFPIASLYGQILFPSQRKTRRREVALIAVFAARVERWILIQRRQKSIVL